MAIKRFVLMQALFGGVLNAVLNGPTALIILREDTTWHLWKSFPSLVLDTCGMAFGIAWGTGWLLTTSLRKQIAAGKVAVQGELPARVKEDFSKWPANAFQRGLNLGALAVLVFALPVIGVMFVSGVESWGWEKILLYKTLFGGVVGAVMTPMVAVGVLVEERARVEVAAPVVDPQPEQ